MIDVLDAREYDIIDILLKSPKQTISNIARRMNLSDKTISKSLDAIDDYFKGSDIALIRKPKVGIFLDGNLNSIRKSITRDEEGKIPNSREERIKFLCFEVLDNYKYFTYQKLSNTLYISKTTLEKDMQQVNEVFNKFHNKIESVPGKGSFLNISEYERRKLTLDLIQYFWDQNWQITKQGNQYFHLLEDVPNFINKFIDVDKLKDINDIVQKYLNSEHLNISDLNYQTLILVMLITIKRINSKNIVKMGDKFKVKGLHYSESLQLLLKNIEIIFNITIPETESEYIQQYIRDNTVICSEDTATKVNDDDIKRIILTTNTVIAEYVDGSLIHHLKTAFERIQRKLPVINPYIQDIKNKFPLSFEEAIAICRELERFYNISIPESEIAYVAMYVQTRRESLKMKRKYLIRVLIVCSTGKGTSRLLAARLRRTFQEIKISRIVSIQELNDTKIEEDLVLSTVKITLPGHHLIVVSPLVNEEDERNIKRFIEVSSKTKNNRNIEFSKLINSELVFLDKKLLTKEEVINFIGEQLVKLNYAKKGVSESALERERLSSTAFEKYATPHAKAEFINKSAIVFIRLKNEINWLGQNMRFIFFICVKNETPNQLDQIFDTLLEIIEENKEHKEHTLKNESPDNIVCYLKEGI